MKEVEVTQDQKRLIDQYIEQERRKAVEDARKQFANSLSQTEADIRRARRAMQANERILDTRSDALQVANEASPHLPKMLKLLFRKLHREFLTIDNYEEYQSQKPRNWPLIIGITSLLFGGYLYYQYQTQFWVWVYTGYNGWALGLLLILFVVGYFYQRNREEKKLQQRDAA